MLTRFALYLLLLSPLVLGGCFDDDDKKAEGMPVKVGPPIQKTLTEWDEFTGRFRARDRVEIRARVSGYLEKVLFEDGQTVKKGDALFIIDQRPFRIDLARTESTYEVAKKDYERARSLVRSSAGTQQLVDQRFQELREAKAALEQAKLNLEFTRVESPIDGRVSRHLVDVGNLISGGDLGATLLTTVVSEDPIDFYFEASEQEILKYIRLDKEGKRESSRTAKRPVFVKLQDEKDFVHEGTIDFVDNEVDRETGTLLARAVFPNPDGSLLAGVFGRLRMAGSGEYLATLVPDDVIATNQSLKFVYVVNKDNMLEPRPVTLGPLHDGGLRIIREGLTPEDTVVMAGLTMLRPGIKVKPMPVDAPAEGAPADKDKDNADAAKE